MKQRIFIFVVVGEVRIKAADARDARDRMRAALIGLEWSMDHPTARLKRDDSRDEKDPWEI